MKQRVHTWLTIVAGAIALPLLAACVVALVPTVEAASVSPSAFHPMPELLPSEAALMSCADPIAASLPEPPSPLWCEDTDVGARCAPASPSQSQHDFSHASPVLLAVSPAPGAPAFTLVQTRHTARINTLVSRMHAVRIDRPPRA